MKKIGLALTLLLAAFMGGEAWAGGSSTYYYKMRLRLTSNSTGSGKVYATCKDSSKTDTTSAQSTDITHTISRYDNNDINTGSAYAVPGRGSLFDGWYNDEAGTQLATWENSKDSGTTITIRTATKTTNPLTPCFYNVAATKDSSAVTKNFYAKFIVNPNNYKLTLEKPEGVASYTVTGSGFDGTGIAQGGEATVYKDETFSFTCTPSADYTFHGWKVTDSGGSKTYPDASLSLTFSADVTVAADVRSSRKYTVTCQGKEGGSYKANGQIVSGTDYPISDGPTVVVALSDVSLEEGYEFLGWYKICPNGEKEFYTYTGSCQVEEKSDISIGAEIRRKADVTLTFDTENTDFTVNGVAPSNSQVTYSNVGTQKLTLSTSDEPSMQPKWWYKVGDDEQKTYFSYSRVVEWTFAENVTVGVDFFHTEQSLAKQLEGHEASELRLTADAEIADETAFTIPAGKTVVVPTNVTLYVDGALTLADGADIVIEQGGRVSQCLKLVKQSGNGLEPKVPEGSSVKYWVTRQATANASISGWTGTATTHLTVMRGDGSIAHGASGISDSAYWVDCAFEGAAVNQIKSIGGYSNSEDVGSPTSAWSNHDCLLLKKCRVAGPCHSSDGRLAYTGKMECAGQECWLDAAGCQYKGPYNNVEYHEKYGDGEVSSQFIGKFFNPAKVTFKPNKYWQNGDAAIYNCPDITITELKNLGGNIFEFYDCGPKVSVSRYVDYDNEPADATYRIYGGRYDVDFTSDGMLTRSAAEQSEPSGVYAGTFPVNLDALRASSISKAKKFYQLLDGYWRLEANQDTSVAMVGDNSYSLLDDGINASGTTALGCLEDYDSVTITLKRDVTVNQPYTLAAGKTLVLELNGCEITAPNGFIKNMGTLEIRDGSGHLGNSGIASVGANVVETIGKNAGTTICYGAYRGNIVAKDGGSVTIHHGRFFGSMVSDLGDFDFRGGIYSQDMTDLVPEGYKCFEVSSSEYRVGRYPWVDVAVTARTETEVGYVLNAIPAEDRNLYLTYKGTPLSGMSSKDDWLKVAEFRAAYDYYADHGCVDVMVQFDRDIVGGMTVKAKGYPADVPATSANTLVRVLSANLDADAAQITYSRFMQGNFADMTGSLGDASLRNKGVTCRFMMELFSLKNFKKKGANGRTDLGEDNLVKWMDIADERFVIGAGANTAMIRPDAGEVSFFATIADAVAAVNAGGTIMLCNDTDESLTVTRPCTIRLNGFTAGTIGADKDLNMEKEVSSDGLVSYTFTVPMRRISIAVPGNAVIDTVQAGGVNLKASADGRYEVPPGTALRVVYRAADGCFGNVIEKTVAAGDVTDGMTVSLTADEAASFKQLVAKVGDDCYDSLAGALEAAQYANQVTLFKDCSEQIAIAQACTLAIAMNGHNFTGSFTPVEGLELKGQFVIGGVTRFVFVEKQTQPPAEEPSGDDPAPSEPTPAAEPAPAVVVTESWVQENVGSDATPEQVVEKLQSVDTEKDNGLKVWENVALENAGVKTTADDATPGAVSTETKQSADTTKPVEVEVTITTNETVKSVGFAKLVNPESGTKEIDKSAEATTKEQVKTVVSDAGEAKITVNLADLPAGVYTPTVVIESNGVEIEKPDPTAKSVQVVKNAQKKEKTVLTVPHAKALDDKKVTVASLIDTSSLNTNDSILVYNKTAGKFEGWSYKGDGTWHSMYNDGEVSAAATNVWLEPGQAVILEREGDSTNNVVTMVGEFTTNAVTSEITKPAAAVSAAKDKVWNLVGNANQDRAYDLNKIENPNAGDQIVVPTAGLPRQYALSKEGKWCYKTNAVKKVGSRTTVYTVTVTNSTVGAGEGFWYVSGGGDNKTEINWKK